MVFWELNKINHIINLRRFIKNARWFYHRWWKKKVLTINEIKKIISNSSKNIEKESLNKLSKKQRWCKESINFHKNRNEDISFDINLGDNEESENNGNNENINENELKYDCPYTIIEDFSDYYQNPNEHPILNKNYISNNPSVIEIGGDIEIPIDKQKIINFIKYFSELKNNRKINKNIMDSIHKDTGIEKELDDLLQYVPDAKKTYICQKHYPPKISETKYCEECNSESCDYQYHFNPASQIAHVLSLLTIDEYNEMKENIKKMKTISFEDYMKEDHNLYDIDSGIQCAALNEREFGKDSDLIFPVLYSCDGVEVSKTGKKINYYFVINVKKIKVNIKLYMLLGVYYYVYRNWSVLKLNIWY